ncbi:MAG: sigma-70 family RNA polymerase sigma factor, partial [Planctomycetales bacterium]|nr:sigma-70 family RNA polymerase sigma factor [Planctomycetales bacterium]
DLIESARAGSAEALGSLLDAFRDYLTLIAERELDGDLRAKGGASDIVQETFLEAQVAFGKFESHTQDELLAWLRVMLQNNLADFRRRYRDTQKRSAHREVNLIGEGSSGNWGDALGAQLDTPSGQFITQETMQQVETALACLPDDYQQVIRWRYFERCSFEEIASRLQRSTNAAQKLLIRAIDRLRSQLEMN